MFSSDDAQGQLLLRCAQRDSAALRTLYDEVSPQLFAVLLRILSSKELAEEALQDVFLIIWHKAGGYNAVRGRPMAWMVGIARYRALDVRRSRKRDHLHLDIAGMAETLPAGTGEAAVRVSSTHDEDRLSHCMDGLSQQQRECIQLGFLSGLTHEEMAHKLDSPIGTIKSWVRRGLRALRECLDR